MCRGGIRATERLLDRTRGRTSLSSSSRLSSTLSSLLQDAFFFSGTPWANNPHPPTIAMKWLASVRSMLAGGSRSAPATPAASPTMSSKADQHAKQVSWKDLSSEPLCPLLSPSAFLRDSQSTLYAVFVILSGRVVSSLIACSDFYNPSNCTFDQRRRSAALSGRSSASVC